MRILSSSRFLLKLYYYLVLLSKMFRYVLAILLVTCYYSLGNPVRTVHKQISTSIVELTNNCGNVFLKNLLNSKVNECSDFVPPYKTKQLQCLMFYEMCTKLCTEVSASGITLNEDYTSKINEETDVNNLCETAKNWTFRDLQEYHSYKTIIEKIFKHPVTCGTICGSDELMTDDANFYCKFYKWGWDVIKNQVNTASQNGTNVNAVAELQPNVATNPNKSVISSNETLDIPIKNTTSNDLQKETELSPDPVSKTSDSKHADAKQIAPEVAMTNNGASDQIAVNAIKKTEQSQEGIKKSEIPTNLEQDIEKEVKEPQNKNMSTVPLSGTGKEEIKFKPEEKEVVLDNPKDKDEVKESVLENPKDKALMDSEHYGDDDFNSEDGKEGNEDLQGEDDAGDPMINDNVKPLEKKTETSNKIESVDSTFNKEISQREFYSGNAQDIGPDDNDDDDHFFTFFLTAIVLVVLLYILYHDKSKISKLFFGLLVEGRQGGRRRNSRGHAYRRLDTLEQAMSTNTTAPPSKIIY